MPLTQVFPRLVPEVFRGSDFADAINARASQRPSLDSLVITDGHSPYSVADGDHLIIADASAGPITIDLPPAPVSFGRVVRVKVISVAGGNVTLDGDASETIDGATTKVLSAQWASAALYCTGSSWLLL